jgi:hypothetical protein
MEIHADLTVIPSIPEPGIFSLGIDLSNLTQEKIYEVYGRLLEYGVTPRLRLMRDRGLKPYLEVVRMAVDEDGIPEEYTELAEAMQGWFTEVWPHPVIARKGRRSSFEKNQEILEGAIRKIKEIWPDAGGS